MRDTSLRLGMLGRFGDEPHPQQKAAQILGCAAFGDVGMLTQELYREEKILFKHPQLPKWPLGRARTGVELGMNRIPKHPQTSPTNFCA